MGRVTLVLACIFIVKEMVHRRPANAAQNIAIARASALEGDTAEANAAYQDFLTIWRDADYDISVLIATKSEFSKIK